MKKFLLKLKESRGETLVEVLVSILVGSLSVMILVTLIVTSVRISDTTKDYDGTYYKDLSEAERQKEALDEAGGSTNQVTVKVDGSPLGSAVSGKQFFIGVDYFGGEKIFSYKIK